MANEDNEVQYRYALTAEGDLLDVMSLEPGLATHLRPTGLICCGCKDPVVLRLGISKRNHLAHKRPARERVNCSNETRLHNSAKLAVAAALRDVADNHGSLTLCAPKGLTTRLHDYLGSETGVRHSALSEEMSLSGGEVLVEKNADGLRPDVLLDVDGILTFFEVAVFHKSSAQKIASGNRILEFNVEHDDHIAEIVEMISTRHEITIDGERVVSHNIDLIDQVDHFEDKINSDNLAVDAESILAQSLVPGITFYLEGDPRAHLVQDFSGYTPIFLPRFGSLDNPDLGDRLEEDEGPAFIVDFPGNLKNAVLAMRRAARGDFSDVSFSAANAMSKAFCLQNVPARIEAIGQYLKETITGLIKENDLDEYRGFEGVTAASVTILNPLTTRIRLSSKHSALFDIILSSKVESLPPTELQSVVVNFRKSRQLGAHHHDILSICPILKGFDLKVIRAKAGSLESRRAQAKVSAEHQGLRFRTTREYR